MSAPIRIQNMAANTNHITASQQWQLATLTRQKVSRETRAKDPNLRRLVGLCNTLDSYSSKLEELHSLRHIPGHARHDSTIDDDDDDDHDQETDADYGEGQVLEWFGDFGDDDLTAISTGAPSSTMTTTANEGRVVDVGKLVDIMVQEVDGSESDSEEGDSDGSSWADGEDEETYFSDSSVDEVGGEKD
ncbi:hypothetical protein E2P81_ATG01436 [Venturia nashicola]|uniref:Uncharacterized protein n=1 Tax=Venturia nashicola TaxID=86259 RepID=A0A4Z1PS62_9PEZI|nr:hypothetical protein E6O75_ATG01468 [Venturia nashicola]TLD38893.1 hypothetical protein E2P81_ATG01436 [Venturia nashicola]